MAEKRLKRPRDPISLAKLIGDIATGQVKDGAEDGKDPSAIAKGRAGGLLGGKKRAETLPSKRRIEIAKKAATARWAKKSAAKEPS
ncbi:hypothetical protein [Nevskia soli]|uniref:hypothetical protein n=1 Tax=Nevskia soli TaxID=418856 RepID=UPI000A0496A5|nr:hypothetical protein [Nevskia soli]